MITKCPKKDSEGKKKKNTHPSMLGRWGGSHLHHPTWFPKFPGIPTFSSFQACPNEKAKNACAVGVGAAAGLPRYLSILLWRTCHIENMKMTGCLYFWKYESDNSTRRRPDCRRIQRVQAGIKKGKLLYAPWGFKT